MRARRINLDVHVFFPMFFFSEGGGDVATSRLLRGQDKRICRHTVSRHTGIREKYKANY
jgi:hypothetical protein